MGIRGNAYNWIKSYLHDRKQYVDIDNYKSEIQSMTTGVPQSSILGSILYLLCVNDIPCELVNSIVASYADDTTVVSTGASVHVTQALSRLCNLYFILHLCSINEIID